MLLSPGPHCATHTVLCGKPFSQFGFAGISLQKKPGKFITVLFVKYIYIYVRFIV